MRYTLRPISDRTPFAGPEKSNPFRSTWQDTLKLLAVELELLDASNVVIEVDVPDESQIRLDGMLRSGALVNSGAIRLAFDSIHGPLTYATDRFYGAYAGDPPDWQINVRAIALGLEALRKIERYGIVKRDEQYLGFKQLGAGRAMPASHMTSSEATALLANYAPEGSSIDLAYKLAKRATHPDLGGDRAEWDKVEEAAKLLRVIT